MTGGALRLALVGLGIHGERYANHLLRNDIPGARLVAVCRRDANRGRAFASRHGLAFFEDATDAATLPHVDAVIAVLPPDRHPEVVESCIASGRPVLVEKPLATGAPAAERIARAVAKAEARVMVAHTLRFDPLIERLRDEAASLGALRLVAVNQRLEPEGPDWLDSAGPGGAILNTGVHGFDLLRHLTGAEPVSVLAEITRHTTRVAEDGFAAVFRMEPGGLLATIDNARFTAGRTGRIEIAGERGQVVGDHIHRTLYRIEGRERRDLGPVPARPTVVETIRRFRAWLGEGGPPPVGVDDGHIAVLVAEAVARAASLGRRVNVERPKPSNPR